MAIQIDEYLRADGSNPYKAWFDGLEAQAAAKVTMAKLRLELGNTSSVKWFAGMGEYVIDWGPGLRIYLVSRHSPNDGLHSSSTRIAALQSLSMPRHGHADCALRCTPMTSRNSAT